VTDEDFWARSEARLRAVLAVVEHETRAVAPGLAVVVSVSRDSRAPLAVVAEFHDRGAPILVLTVLFAWSPAPHGLRGALVRSCKVEGGLDSGFAVELAESLPPASLGLNPSDTEVEEAMDETVAWARRAAGPLLRELGGGA
jgi:hypothetical protein